MSWLLWCLVEDYSTLPFVVTIPGNINTQGLRTLIQAVASNLVSKDLILWKVRTIVLDL